MTEKTISKENDNSDSGLFVPKPDNKTFDATCQSDVDITNAKAKSTDERALCSEQENNHGSEMLWKASVPNQDHSVTQDSKENLPPRQPFTSKTHPPNPALLAETLAQGTLSPRTPFHLDLSYPLPPALKNQSEPMNPLCKQSMWSPTGMKSLGKESQKQISCNEEKLIPKVPHRLSSGPLKALDKDSCLVAPGIHVENTQSASQCNTVKSAVPVPTVDGPNPGDPGIEFLR